MAVARYRDRHTVSRKKSDHQDAVVLANILRTDTEFHRPLPTDSDLVRAIAVLARAQQDAVWDRTRAHNRLRSHLREYYPAILEAFATKRERLLSREARTILSIAPTPAEAARLSRGRLRTAVTRAGRQRRIEAETDRLLQVFRQSRLRQPTLVEQAMGRQTLALLARLAAACQACDDLASDTEELFLQHPDAEIITSFLGLATLTGARILAEIGDDRARFTHAGNLKACAGSAPVTRQSGKSRHVAHRRIKNNRLAATGRHWAFAALTASPAHTTTTTADGTPATTTTRPSAICSTACSASSTAALPTARGSTKRSPSAPPPQLHSRQLLDPKAAWGVLSSVPAPRGHRLPHAPRPLFRVVGRGPARCPGRVLMCPAGGRVDVHRPLPALSVPGRRTVRRGGIGLDLQLFEDGLARRQQQCIAARHRARP